jgi:hypothetical protein
MMYSSPIFEYTNQRPVFGIIGSDSALYAPLLGFFVFTGIPTSVRIHIRAVPIAVRQRLVVADRLKSCCVNFRRFCG